VHEGHCGEDEGEGQDDLAKYQQAAGAVVADDGSDDGRGDDGDGADDEGLRVLMRIISPFRRRDDTILECAQNDVVGDCSKG
jgi:hypothetical protein